MKTLVKIIPWLLGLGWLIILLRFIRALFIPICPVGETPEALAAFVKMQRKENLIFAFKSYYIVLILLFLGHFLYSFAKKRTKNQSHAL